MVTGAAVGIGQAIACRLAEYGARLVLADIGDCTETLRMVEDAGGEAIVVTADLRDDPEVGRLVDVGKEGRLPAVRAVDCRRRVVAPS